MILILIIRDVLELPYVLVEHGILEQAYGLEQEHNMAFLHIPLPLRFQSSHLQCCI